MIAINDFKIQSHPFQIKEVTNNSFDLTTAISYENNFPADGGVSIIPLFEVRPNLDATLFITQVCKRHHLKVEIDGHEPFEFSITDYKDTTSSSSTHYSKHPIINSRFFDPTGNFEEEVKFWDAPYRELFNHWRKFEYNISFETWFQLLFDNRLAPIASIKWELDATCIKETEGWVIKSSRNSKANDIYRSVQRYDLNDPPLDTSGLPHLTPKPESSLIRHRWQKFSIMHY